MTQVAGLFKGVTSPMAGIAFVRIVWRDAFSTSLNISADQRRRVHVLLVLHEAAATAWITSVEWKWKQWERRG